MLYARKKNLACKKCTHAPQLAVIGYSRVGRQGDGREKAPRGGADVKRRVQVARLWGAAMHRSGFEVQFGHQGFEGRMLTLDVG